MMKAITYPTYKKVLFLEQQIEVPLWVKYLALKPRVRGDKADIIGFTHKPHITARFAQWRLPTHSNGTMEPIGYATECSIKFDDSANVFKTLTKVPE